MAELSFDQGVDADSVSPELRACYGELRKLSIFSGVSGQQLVGLIAAGGIECRVYDRDMFVIDPDGGPDTRIYFVCEGQVAVGVFDSAILSQRAAEQRRIENMSEEEREQLSLLPPPPLAREAKKNLAAFMTGDLFNGGAMARGPETQVAFFTAAPTTLLVVSHSAMAEIAVRHPEFEQRIRRAIETGRRRLHNVAGVKQEILDFFVRQGISVSGEMVRVRQLDRCIDCKLCEQACETRYGSRRLTLGGYQLGMLDFVYTCRTCVDQRCVDPCEYDSISFDPERNEVVINEATCTGCTLCAQSCPYGAIEMVEVEDPAHPSFRPAFKKRLDKRGALAFGPGTGRVGRVRRIANKCDHCVTYGDQACVSACPTGALIEISAYDLFRERTEAQELGARTGYEQPPGRDRDEILPIEPFTKGIGVSDAGMAKIKRGRMGPVFMWGLGLSVWTLVFIEILLRLWSPENSLQYVLLRRDGLEPAIARLKVGFRAGSDLAVYCGYVGTALMLISVIYPVWRRAAVFRRIASNTMWFDFHMMAGTVGPMFIVLHSALKLDNWVSAAFWSMMIVVISGVAGRYLYTQVPDLLNGRELEELDHQRALRRIRMQNPQAVMTLESELNIQRANAQRVADRAGLWGAFLWILGEDLRRPTRWLHRRAVLRQSGLPRRVRRELAYRIGRLILMERRRVLVPRAQLLLHAWKKVHVPFSLVMTAISVVHIYVAFVYSM